MKNNYNASELEILRNSLEYMRNDINKQFSSLTRLLCYQFIVLCIIFGSLLALLGY